jgi:hypothetical protein
MLYAAFVAKYEDGERRLDVVEYRLFNASYVSRLGLDRQCRFPLLTRLSAYAGSQSPASASDGLAN